MTNTEQKSLETEFSIVICRQFLTIFYLRSIVLTFSIAAYPSLLSNICLLSYKFNKVLKRADFSVLLFIGSAKKSTLAKETTDSYLMRVQAPVFGGTSFVRSLSFKDAKFQLKHYGDFLIWNFDFVLIRSFDIFISGTLDFFYLELRLLHIWSCDIFLSGTLDFSYLELRILLSGAVILFSSGVLISPYLDF